MLKELVVGDVLVLEAGYSMITADARLIRASQMRVEESALTGESEPVEKILHTWGMTMMA